MKMLAISIITACSVLLSACNNQPDLIVGKWALSNTLDKCKNPTDQESIKAKSDAIPYDGMVLELMKDGKYVADLPAREKYNSQSSFDGNYVLRNDSLILEMSDQTLGMKIVSIEKDKLVVSLFAGTSCTTTNYFDKVSK